MNDKFLGFLVYAGIGLLVVAVVTLIVLICSLPFALLGAILLLAINIFTPVAMSYWGCAVVGLAAYAIGHLVGR